MHFLQKPAEDISFLKIEIRIFRPPSVSHLLIVLRKKRAFVCSTHIYSRKPAAPAFEWGKNRSVFEKKYSFRPLFMPNRSVRSCVPAALMQADAFGKRRGNLLNLMRNDIVLQY